MAACLLLSAYFSATETAFSSANSTRLKTLAEKGNKNAALACRLLGQYDKLLSTILIGNNIVNIPMASIGTVLFVRCYGDAGATISTVVVTVVVLIFGEISPKSIAKDCAERFAMRLSADSAGASFTFSPRSISCFRSVEEAAGQGVPPERGEQDVAEEELHDAWSTRCSRTAASTKTRESCSTTRSIFPS